MIVSILIWAAILISAFLYPKLHKCLNYVAQLLVNASRMDIVSIEITRCDESSFMLSLTARIYDTGPIDANISSMTLSMRSSRDGSVFAKVVLPTVNATPLGTICSVTSQRIQILDLGAFHTFNENLLLREELPIYVKGESTLTVPWPVRLTTTIKYEKLEILRGFNGVDIKVLEARKPTNSLVHGKLSGIEVDVCITSVSQVSIHLGMTHVEIVHSTLRVANLRADVFLRPGENKITFTGGMDLLEMGKKPKKGLGFLKKDVVDDEAVVAFVKGVQGEQCPWLDRTIKLMDSRITMDSTVADLARSLK